MNSEYAIVDLFAGPGGLAEGFSGVRGGDGSRPFHIALSVEKESSAFDTLRLRSFLRQFEGLPPDEYYQFLNGEISEPDWNSRFPEEWTQGCRETLQLELGAPGTGDAIDAHLARIIRKHGSKIILIGGPPCQAYSLVGRARNKGTRGYDARKDHRHFLYREYIRILQKLMPVAFVMENVKGLLSSSVDGKSVFDQVLDDLSRVGGGAYHLVPLTPRSDQDWLAATCHPTASDFLVRSEVHGIPQARHRVIIVGLRREIVRSLHGKEIAAGLLPILPPVAVRDLIKGMPKLRSGMSVGDDGDSVWKGAILKVMRGVSGMATRLSEDEEKAFRQKARSAVNLTVKRPATRRSGGPYAGVGPRCPVDLKRWLLDARLKRFPNNESRGHMTSDLARYFFAALYARVKGVSPKAKDFPSNLAPDHQNWKTGKFADRFRVQLWSEPATTITSHISKDGHYFIHPDQSQCRSLTVREAARLQTFPDNYFFKGNRTQQFVQVGNAVPPFLAWKIANALHQLLFAAEKPATKLKKAS